MIEGAGAFALIWLLCWFGLSVLFVLLYPAVRQGFFWPHPRVGSLLLLSYWSAPFLLGLLLTGMLFLPGVDAALVHAHCHDGQLDCMAHAPYLGAALPAGLGLMVFLGILVALTVHLLRELQAARRLQADFAALGARGEAYQLLDLPQPMVFTLGWWHPQVYVSQALLAQCDPLDLQVVLCHEAEHGRRRDNLRLLLARVFGVLLPSRLIQPLLSDVRLLIEQACDFRAAQVFGAVQVADTLLRMQRLIQTQTLRLPQNASAFAETDVELRIRAVLDAHERPVPRREQWLALALGLASVFLAVIGPLHYGTEWLFELL